ncbi:MAG: anticodon nuclease [Hymenobacter sp.]|nr:anticodon nuclease [Hymenobacter sp.]
MDFLEIANNLKSAKENIILVYAFNGTGKTRLSVAYKDSTKLKGLHTGVYYNAFSEDLFTWDNDEDNDGQKKVLKVVPSSLNQFHSLITEDDVKEKSIAYNPGYNFYFNPYSDASKGIESISFYAEGDEETPIKISRGEERIFVWCFFLALFEKEGMADEKNAHFFIDDPVSSLDDHNIFITANLISELIIDNFESRKIIITTHHLGIYSILSDFLRKGENAGKFRENDKEKTPKFKIQILEKRNNELKLINGRKAVMLYHLRLLHLLEKAKDDEIHYLYHFAWLRQILENVSSFLGKGNFGYALEQIGITDANRVADIINALSHKRVYYFQSTLMNEQEEEIFQDVFTKLKEKYRFELHAD